MLPWRKRLVCKNAYVSSRHFYWLLVGCTGREEKERRYLAADHKFYQAKDYKRAVIAFRDAAQSVPTDPEAQYQPGQAS